MARIETYSDEHVYIAFDPAAEVASTNFELELAFIDLDADGHVVGLEAVGELARHIISGSLAALRGSSDPLPQPLQEVLA